MKTFTLFLGAALSFNAFAAATPDTPQYLC